MAELDQRLERHLGDELSLAERPRAAIRHVVDHRQHKHPRGELRNIEQLGGAAPARDAAPIVTGSAERAWGYESPPKSGAIGVTFAVSQVFCRQPRWNARWIVCKS